MSVQYKLESNFDEDLINLMNESVFVHPTLKNTLVLRQLENPTLETYKYMLEKLTRLSDTFDYHYAISDSSKLQGKFSKEMRHFGKQYMEEKRNPIHIASVSETNVLMKLMIKFMAGIKPQFSYSIHKTYEDAECELARIIEKNEEKIIQKRESI